MFNRLQQFKLIDEQIADKALETFERHKWYLVPETIPFVLFSDKITIDEKSRISIKMLRLPRPEHFQFGVPKFPDIDINTDLSDLVTSRSWLFFDVLKISPD